MTDADNVNMKHLTSRRSFLKVIAASAATVLMAPVAKVQSVFAEMVKADDALAKALSYVADAKKADPAKRKDKKAVCSNCQFYTETDSKAKIGKCQLIQSGDVAGAGWCTSYSLKQKKA